jgi:nitroreductase
MNSFHQLLQSRRSIRKYLPQNIEQEKITQLTNAVLMSPASKRSNPWEFIVVQDKEILLKLSVCKQHSSAFLAESPLGIVVIADTHKSDIWMEDSAIAAIIMQLQAQDLGLGSCWIQVYGRKKDDVTSAENYIRGLLSIPERFAVLCVISIGYPNEEKKPFDDNKLAIEKIHNEMF